MNEEQIQTEQMPPMRPFIIPPDGALVRSYGILGNNKKGVIGVAEMSRSALWSLVNEGRFPKPLKIGRVTYWRAEDLREWLSDPENYRVDEK